MEEAGRAQEQNVNVSSDSVLLCCEFALPPKQGERDAEFDVLVPIDARSDRFHNLK